MGVFPGTHCEPSLSSSLGSCVLGPGSCVLRPVSWVLSVECGVWSVECGVSSHSGFGHPSFHPSLNLQQWLALARNKK
jgi:hypothetical protein